MATLISAGGIAVSAGALVGGAIDDPLALVVVFTGVNLGAALTAASRRSTAS